MLCRICTTASCLLRKHTAKLVVITIQIRQIYLKVNAFQSSPFIGYLLLGLFLFMVVFCKDKSLHYVHLPYLPFIFSLYGIQNSSQFTSLSTVLLFLISGHYRRHVIRIALIPIPVDFYPPDILSNLY